MKKLLFFAAFSIFALTTTVAQEDNDSSVGVTGEGTWLVEINTGFGEASTANTGFAFRSTDGVTSWAIGGEAGYFILDDLALKAGLGYADTDVDGVETDGIFNWKFGAKYYIVSQFPVQVDVNGASQGDASPLWLGLQAGYAWFVADNVSIEPGVRYGLGMNEDAGDGDFNLFGINIGFNIFFS